MHAARIPIFLALLWTIIQAAPGLAQDQTGPTAAIEITDASGKTIRLETLPQRLAVVGRGPQYLLHLLYMFPEGPQRLVGMEQRGRTASDFLSAMIPEIDRKAALLPNPGPEAVAGLHPDLVLMKSAGTAPLGETLAKISIPTACFGLETAEQYYRDIANLGAILGNAGRAEEIISFYKEGVDRVEKSMAGLREEEKPKVLVIMGNERSGKYAVRVPAQSWMQTNQVRVAGGRPVWLEAAQQAGGWAVVNLEQIAVWDPDQLIIIVWYTTNSGEFMKWLASDPQWNKLRVVRENKVRYFPSDYYGWDVPDVRWLLGLTWMASILHPDRLKGYDLEDEVFRFYGRLYGLDREIVKKKILPLIKTDFR